MKKVRNLLSITLVLLLVTITSITFAYWDFLTSNKGGNIDLGEGKTITLTDNQLAVGNLIPAGKAKTSEDVYFIDVKYDVNVSHFVEGFELVVTPQTSNELLVATVLSYEQFSESNLTKTVTIRFTLNEPVDEQSYEALQANALSYSVNFAYKQI